MRCKVAFQSYSMRVHWEDAHPSDTMPPNLVAQVALRYHERELMRDRRGKSKTGFAVCVIFETFVCVCSLRRVRCET